MNGLSYSRALGTLALQLFLFVSLIVYTRLAFAENILVDSGGFSALENAINIAKPGDIVEVSQGNYDSESFLFIRKSGSASAPITLRAKPGSRPVFPRIRMDNVQYWNLSGFEISNHGEDKAIIVEGANSRNLVFDNLKIHHIKRGIVIMEGQNYVIRNCEMYEIVGGKNSDADAIHIYFAKNTGLRGM